MEMLKYVSADADFFVGRRGNLKRYLVCPMQGHFPVVVKTGPGSAAAIFRTGATHIGISGTLAVSTSADGGKSWSDPVEIVPRWEDSRNPAFGVNANGELIAAFWKAGLHRYTADSNGMRWDGSAWRRNAEKVDAVFCCKSPDGGKTWSEPAAIRSELLLGASPYGRMIAAPDGTLLMCLYGLPRDEQTRDERIAVVVRSTDGGETWGGETLVTKGHNETSFAFLPDGRMIAAARSAEGAHVSILRSEDAGRTWSEPEQITRDGEHPADLCVLTSGNVLMTFGRRISPRGCGALMSSDGGKTWDFDHEALLAGDSPGSDCGYPSTIQFDDGSIATLVYFAAGSQMAEDGGGGPWGKCSCQALHYRESDILQLP
jgi:hypothetical protein